MMFRLRWSTATVLAGIALAVLATWLLASGPKCEPGSDWPSNWAQARALKDAWLRESGCRQSNVQCSYHFRGAPTGDFDVTVQATAVDESTGQCIFTTDNQRHYVYLPTGAPDPAASSPQ